ncbi:MAG: hypothetical protein WA991_07270 [Ornithinimicrobium sp.]
MAGLTNDVCIVFPSILMVQESFRVQVVQDAGGSPNTIGEDAARRRWESYGVVTTSTNQLIAQLGVDWSTADGGKLIAIRKSSPTLMTCSPRAIISRPPLQQLRRGSATYDSPRRTMHAAAP